MGVNINSEVLNRCGLTGGGGGGGGGGIKFGYYRCFMNAIERYLQAQSRTETLTRYYSYPLNARTEHTEQISGKVIVVRVQPACNPRATRGI